MLLTTQTHKTSGTPALLSPTKMIIVSVVHLVMARVSRLKAIPCRTDLQLPVSTVSMYLILHVKSDHTMPILSKEQAQALLKKVLSYSKADECEVNLTGTDGGNVRYARNSVSTSGIVSQSQ